MRGDSGGERICKQRGRTVTAPNDDVLVESEGGWEEGAQQTAACVVGNRCGLLEYRDR